MVEITEASIADLDNLETVSSSDLDDIDDETLSERLWGLTEMFPDSLRNVTWKTNKMTVNAIKSLYKFSRSTLWIVGTSFVILGMPVLFEVERVQTEEAQLMQQRQILLGPGGGSGAGGPGLVPQMGMQPQRR